jgi:hypothetical protein
MNLDEFIEKYQDLLPKNFDWQFYVNYYADLKQAGIVTENLAKYHYIRYGNKENREYIAGIGGVNKIFQIGFNKAGTCSIHSLFKNYSKLPSIHWDNGNLAKNIHNNIQNGEKLPLEDYDNYTVYNDMECFVENNGDLNYIMIGKEYFDILDVNYPNSVFIFNTRPIKNWIKSRLNHKHNNIMYIDLHMKALKTSNKNKIIDYWEQEYYSYYNDIVNYFSRHPNKLLIFDIENDPFSKFSSYFEARNIVFTTRSMPHDNRTKKQ